MNSKKKCPRCGGEGECYDPADRDCIEGYKLAQKKICLLCMGSGVFKEPKPIRKHPEWHYDRKERVLEDIRNYLSDSDWRFCREFLLKRQLR